MLNSFKHGTAQDWAMLCRNNGFVVPTRYIMLSSPHSLSIQPVPVVTVFFPTLLNLHIPLPQVFDQHLSDLMREGCVILVDCGPDCHIHIIRHPEPDIPSSPAQVLAGGISDLFFSTLYHNSLYPILQLYQSQRFVNPPDGNTCMDQHRQP